MIKEEIDGLCKCGTCYANAHAYPDNWFTMVCDEPHIVAWAKFQGCNFWPVKIMAAVGRKLSVRFFGDHTHADIAATKCFLFSEQSPAGKSAKTRGGPYQNALLVSSKRIFLFFIQFFIHISVGQSIDEEINDSVSEDEMNEILEEFSEVKPSEKPNEIK